MLCQTFEPYVATYNLTIRAPEGSYAQTYAKENRIPFVAYDPVMPNLSSASPWAREALQIAYEKGYIPSDLLGGYTENVNRGEFCRLAVGFLEYYTGKSIDRILEEKGLVRDYNTFRDTKDPNILAAYLLGIVAGTPTPQGLEFRPGGVFTREAAAGMFRNACAAAGMDVSDTADAGAVDIGLASFPVTRDGLNFCINSGYMSGSSTTELRVNPLGRYIREASILMFSVVR
ncbi:MAG: hypothetical protein LBI44_04565 [Oscillospiraceae bacterium]|nr:hypothetical protein [Oscillospiraceae bacterium]